MSNASRLDGLTPLQLYVVTERANGLSLAQIAAKSDRSKSTVQQALEGAMRKLEKRAA